MNLHLPLLLGRGTTQILSTTGRDLGFRISLAKPKGCDFVENFATSVEARINREIIFVTLAGTATSTNQHPTYIYIFFDIFIYFFYIGYVYIYILYLYI